MTIYVQCFVFVPQILTMGFVVCLSFLRRAMLVYDPVERACATDLLTHIYMTSAPEGVVSSSSSTAGETLVVGRFALLEYTYFIFTIFFCLFL